MHAITRCNHIITLTTDFGYKDPFAAEMKGVILSINPDATLIDITHAIHPQDIEEAAYVIGSSSGFFPQGTIHLVVVDPGVGSERKAIMLEGGGHYFVGPDNGVFSHILCFSSPARGVHIVEEKYTRSMESPTFQGRDVFAPAAAWLSRGLAISEFGPSVRDFIRLPVALPEITEEGIVGEIIYIDHFGNAITNIKRDLIASFGSGYNIGIDDAAIQQVSYYAQGEENKLTCLVNSSGYLELFVNKGNAAEKFGLRKGNKVAINSKFI